METRLLDSRAELISETQHVHTPRVAMKSEPGPPMTLGNAATACVRLIVWCRDCGHQGEPHLAEHARRYGAEPRAKSSCAPDVRAARSTWWSAEPRGGSRVRTAGQALGRGDKTSAGGGNRRARGIRAAPATPRGGWAGNRGSAGSPCSDVLALPAI